MYIYITLYVMVVMGNVIVWIMSTIAGADYLILNIILLYIHFIYTYPPIDFIIIDHIIVDNLT